MLTPLPGVTDFGLVDGLAQLTFAVQAYWGELPPRTVCPLSRPAYWASCATAGPPSQSWQTFYSLTRPA